MKTKAGWFLIVLLLLASCAFQKDAIRPVNDEQKTFAGIRSLHEAGKSRKVVERADAFLTRYPESELARPVKYYRAVHSEKLGQIDVARKYYSELVSGGTASGWGRLAESRLKTLDDHGQSHARSSLGQNQN